MKVCHFQEWKKTVTATVSFVHAAISLLHQAKCVLCCVTREETRIAGRFDLLGGHTFPKAVELEIMR